MSNYDGKSVLVTGAGSGIGAAALAFAAKGGKVCCADINLEGAEQTCRDIKAAGGEAFAYQMDVSLEQDNLSVVEKMVAEFGTVDVAFLNAGIAQLSSLLDIDVETWDRVMAINLRGPFLGLKAVVPVMQRNSAWRNRHAHIG
jgi:NAD(P)-dependent dehydrogenase (short-subunit alcohol dehydrogenase family)